MGEFFDKSKIFQRMVGRPDTAGSSCSQSTCSSCYKNVCLARPDTSCSQKSAQSLALSSLPSMSVASSCNGSELMALVQRRQRLHVQMRRVERELQTLGHASAASSDPARGAERPKAPRAALRARRAELQYQMRHEKPGYKVRVAVGEQPSSSRELPRISEEGASLRPSSACISAAGHTSAATIQRAPSRTTPTIPGALEAGRYAFWPKLLPGAKLRHAPSPSPADLVLQRPEPRPQISRLQLD